MGGVVEVLDHGRFPDPVADWVIVSKHNVFLSHSGVQKNFVEQLCVDLQRAQQSPFFDKHLPRGEAFARVCGFISSD